MAGGKWGQPQPWVWGTSLGKGQARLGHQPVGGGGLVGPMARDMAVGSWGAATQAGPRQEPLLEAAPLSGFAPTVPGSLPQGHYGEGATLGCSGSELPPSPSSPSFVTSCRCSHNPHSRAHHQAFPNNYLTMTALLLVYGWEQQTRDDSHMHPSVQLSRVLLCWLCGHVSASKWTMPAALCWIFCFRENSSEWFSKYISWLYFFSLQ